MFFNKRFKSLEGMISGNIFTINTRFADIMSKWERLEKDVIDIHSSINVLEMRTSSHAAQREFDRLEAEIRRLNEIINNTKKPISRGKRNKRKNVK